MAQIDRETWEWHNIVRTNPQSIIPDLEERLSRIDGLLLHRPDQCDIMTFEGKVPIEELIAFLRVQQPLCPLKWSPLAQKACKDHAEDIGPKGLL